MTDPSSATDGNLAVFDGTSGRLVKDGVPELSGYNAKIGFDAQTDGTYSLVVVDAQRLVIGTNGSAIALAVPTDTSVTINGTTPGDQDMNGQRATPTVTKLTANT